MKLDDGYQFGLGVFETIAVESGRLLLLKEHLERLENSCAFLEITCPKEEEVREALTRRGCPDRGVFKIMVSEKNILYTSRENPYEPDDYEKGFLLAYTKVLRNETSPLVYHKTFHYGDCILEKRALNKRGISEGVFLNTKGELTEGTATNLFFIKGGRLYTPETSCGLLPGVLRRWVLETGEALGEEVRECRIRPEDVKEFEECFVTNSLVGIMPVYALEERRFPRVETVRKWMERYECLVLNPSRPA